MASSDGPADPARQRGDAWTGGPRRPPNSQPMHRNIDECLNRVAAGDQAAREELIAFAAERMRVLAHRMLSGYPTVRRFDDTDDIVQNSLLRLHRALAAVTPESPDRLLGLAALQVRRELLDLARTYTGPESHAANHESDSLRIDGMVVSRVAMAASPTEPPQHLERWTQLHEAAARLPPEERQLFELAWYLGLQRTEAARILGCSLRTVNRRWTRVKAVLRESLPGGPAAAFPD